VRASESHRSFATVAGEQAVRTELLCRKLHRLACKIVVFWLYPALAAAAIQYKSAVKVLRRLFCCMLGLVCVILSEYSWYHVVAANFVVSTCFSPFRI
jgi:uncharacterized membrane protein